MALTVFDCRQCLRQSPALGVMARAAVADAPYDYFVALAPGFIQDRNLLKTSRDMSLGRRFEKFTIWRGLIPEDEFGAAIGTLCLAGRLYRQIDPGVRIPQTHIR